MKKFLKNEKYLEWMLVALVFLLMTAWVFTSIEPGGPDESLRYNVAKYIYEHPGELPKGPEESIRDETWGISYAFSPIVSYMISAVFMGIAGLFGVRGMGLLHAARMADVLFMTVAAALVLQIGKRLFDKEKRWLFSVLVIFLPGYMFMGTYVNTDSLALMAAAMILLAWVRSLDEDWTWKNCILLAAGMGVCFLSYYNAYGWIMCSFFFFCATVLLCSPGTVKERVKFLLGRGSVIALVTFLLAGWWFIRSYFIYDGDILGREASRLCAEKYAKPDYRPSRYPTPEKWKWNLKQFLFYQDDGWRHNWMVTVLVSFVGTFGYFNIFMNETVSKLYLIFLFAGGAGVLLMLREFYWRRSEVVVTRTAVSGKSVKIKTIHTYKEWNRKGLFNLAMVVSTVTPVVLLMHYAYYNDNQAQGRYIMPAVYPVMYFVTCGYGKLLDRYVKKEEYKKWFYRAAAAVWVAAAVGNYLFLIVPSY